MPSGLDHYSENFSQYFSAYDEELTKQNLTKLSRLEPEQQAEAAKQLTEGTIKSVDEYTTEGVSTKYGDNYYRTGAFIVDAFSEKNNALWRVPEAYKLHLDTIQRYLQYDRLQEMGMGTFDSWASRFGETVTALELAPEGTGYRERTRFSRFFNLPQLMAIFKEVADIKTADQLNLPVPEAEYHTVVCKPTEHQKALVKELSKRAEKVHSGNVDAHIDNMLCITSDGRKLGLDQRIVNPALPDEAGTKVTSTLPAISLQKSSDSEGISSYMSESSSKTKEADSGEEGSPIYHELTPEEQAALSEEKKAFGKHLICQARELVKGTPHEKIGLIVHRPEATLEHHREYHKMESELMPVIRELIRKTKSLLEYEISTDLRKNRIYGTQFQAEKVSSQDFRYFAQKQSPDEKPSLAVALRIDQSASMKAFGRLDAAKQAAVAVYEFCAAIKIPLLIYGDTADRSPIEKMSIYSYIDWEDPKLNDKYCLMTIQSHSNNRDGMALQILSEKLIKAPQTTKLLISISDGQPKAMPDYTGNVAISDMKQIIHQYSRKGILFLAAAIGQDKEAICDIYGQERFIDITDLKQLPVRLVQIIARYL